ncbi:MAG: hypothetical protein QXH67_06295 [Candidatus Bathyarchaeia archaeon]
MGGVYDSLRVNELTLSEPFGIVGVAFLARDGGFHELLDSAKYT